MFADGKISFENAYKEVIKKDLIKFVEKIGDSSCNLVQGFNGKRKIGKNPSNDEKLSKMKEFIQEHCLKEPSYFSSEAWAKTTSCRYCGLSSSPGHSEEECVYNPQIRYKLNLSDGCIYCGHVPKTYYQICKQQTKCIAQRKFFIFLFEQGFETDLKTLQFDAQSKLFFQ